VQPELQSRARGVEITQGWRADPEEAGEEKAGCGRIGTASRRPCLASSVRWLVGWLAGWLRFVVLFWLGAALRRAGLDDDGALLLPPPLLLWINQ